MVRVVHKLNPTCLRYNYLDCPIKESHSDGQSVFINCTLGIYPSKIFCSLFTENVSGAMMLKLSQCWSCSPFLSVAALNDLGYCP